MKVFGLNVKTVPDTILTTCEDCVLLEFCKSPVGIKAPADGYKTTHICNNDNYHYELED